LTQIAWPALGIDSGAVHRQPFKLAAYSVKPQGQGALLLVQCRILFQNVDVQSSLTKTIMH